jgi:putative ABC transport system ATP-binding protein
VIELENIGKVFPSGGFEVHALHGLHLRVGAGEFVAVTGPSASGKSTLLSILALLDAPTRGTYRLDGRATSDLGGADRDQLRSRAIGCLFATDGLFPELSARDNVTLGLIGRVGPDGSSRAGVGEALDRVGLAGRIDVPVRDLCGGERQRVAVARAVVGGPRLLLADEPTRNLDTAGLRSVMDTFVRLRREGTTIVMATHDPLAAERAERIVRLVDGRVVGDEPGNLRECSLPPAASRNPTGRSSGGSSQAVSGR